MCQIARSRSTFFFLSSDSSDSMDSSEKNHRTCPQKNHATSFFLLQFFQYFYKEQFDTFDNRCEVLRPVFCNSRGFFLHLKISNIVMLIQDAVIFTTRC